MAGSNTSFECVLRAWEAHGRELLAFLILRARDRNAAEEVGTLFYGTGPDLRGGDFPWGPDLTGLDAWIAEHVE